MTHIDRAKRGVVDGRRIGSGIGWMVAGVGAFLFGCFAALGGGDAAATVFLSLGALCIVIGFWTRLFGALEQRLLEIQVAVLGSAAKAPVEDPTSLAERKDNPASYLG